MRKALGMASMLALTASVGFASTPYTGPWTQTWDFDDGTSQGWALNGSAGVSANLSTGTGSWLYAPDTSYARFDANSYSLGGVYQPHSSTYHCFVLQADVYVGATNYLQGSGIAAQRDGDLKGPWATGTAAGSKGIAGNDKSWYNSTKNKSWGLATGQWSTLQIDYGVTVPGKFSVGYTAGAGNDAGWTAGSWNYAIDQNSSPTNDIHPNQIFRYLNLGGSVNGAQAGWAQAYFDNVKLFVGVPEPVSAALLALGGLMLRRRRLA